MKKNTLLPTIIVAILLIALVSLTPVKEAFYGEGWPRIFIGLCLFVLLAVFVAKGVQKSRQFQKDFTYYVVTFDLTPDKLARLTEFNKKDFSYDKQELLFMNGSPENRQKLLAQLEKQFGPVKFK